MKKSVKVNFIYNLLYQVFLLITPFITTPYVSRVLGSDGIGKYSFAYSLISYFVLFAALGFGVYAQREIARNQNDKQKQSAIFWEIFLVRAVSVAVMTGIHLALWALGLYGDYSTLMLILTVNVVAVAFDITYLFQGNEDFGIIAIRNVVAKVIGIAGIFLFVKTSKDVWVYTLCNVVINIVSNLTLWTKLPSTLERVALKDLHAVRHILPTLRLFIPTLALSVYTMLDKTLIGVLIPGTVSVIDENGVEIVKRLADIENGYYNQAETLVKMATVVVTSLGTVMIPRNSEVIASGDMEKLKENIYGAMQFVFFIGVPITFGLIAVASNFSLWFFGPGYDKVPLLIMCFASLALIIGLSNALGLQYLIPMKADGKYTIAITAGAVINLALNLLLIPLLSSLGACIATIVAEFAITVFMFVFARKDIQLLKVLKNGWRALVAGAVMFAVLFITQSYLESSVLNTFLLVVEGMVVYFLFMLLLRDPVLVALIKKIRRNR